MNTNPTSSGDPLLATVRSILLAEMQEHVRRLEEQILALQEQSLAHAQEGQAQWTGLQAELSAIQELAQANQRLGEATQEELRALQKAALTDTDTITARLTPMMTNLIRRTIRDSHDEMAEALGPVMGEAVRVQIRDSRQEMVDALYPIIGGTVQKAIAEFARELQRNIDARLKATIGPKGLLRTLSARLRGVSAAELTMREAMPFQIGEVFVIQHETGLLIAHSHHLTSEEDDSDLISGMLTAIRSFVHDAFTQAEGQELAEVQYGDEQIIIQSGSYAYVAAVVRGVEPEGFRARLHQLVADLHVRYGNSLRDYDGDPASLPDLQPVLVQWIVDVAGGGPLERQPASPRRRLAWIGAGLLLALGVLLVCFYAWFTARLLPLALAHTPTVTLTFTATSTATFTPTASPTSTFTLIPTATFTSTPLPPTPTFTLPPSLTPTPMPLVGQMTGNTWTRQEPRFSAQRGPLILGQTQVQILAVYGDWVLIQWGDGQGLQRGWVLRRWLSTLQVLPADIITPTP
jgi:hypothetical protein